MEFDFDSAKDAVNQTKHGVPLLVGARVFDDPAVALIDTVRAGDEELRYKAVGLSMAGCSPRFTSGEEMSSD